MDLWKAVVEMITGSQRGLTRIEVSHWFCEEVLVFLRTMK